MERLHWSDDGFEANGIHFDARPDWAFAEWSEAKRFALYKGRRQIEQFELLFQQFPRLVPRRVVELGIWEGGSVVFWQEWLRPEKHVAIDVLDRGDSPHFQRYIDERRLANKVVTYWGVSQAAREQLTAIVAAEFAGSAVDLIIDDASHDLAATRASFEVLFPLLGPGGLYIVEDWNWGLEPIRDAAAAEWAAHRQPPHELVLECAVQSGLSDSKYPITSVVVREHLAAIERR